MKVIQQKSKVALTRFHQRQQDAQKRYSGPLLAFFEPIRGSDPCYDLKEYAFEII
jgi:hypothetical protein